MKRIAIIVIPIFLLVSIAITVYVVMTQRFEVRKKAEEAYQSGFGGKMSGQNTRKIADWCLGGPYIEIEATGTTYNQATGVHTLNLIARRKNPIGSVNPTVAVTPTLVPTVAASPSGAVQGSADFPLRFALLEEGCANGTAKPTNMCTSCGSDDKPFFSSPVWHTIPAGQNELAFSINITKPITQLTCGCTQLDLHIWDVAYDDKPGSISRQLECGTMQPKSGHPQHDYLYGATYGNNCTIAQAPTLTLAPTSIPPTQPPPPPASTSTPQPTTTVNKLPVCTGFTLSPTAGTAPLTVHFVGSGSDANGTIAKFEFTYGDGKTQTIEKNVGQSGSVEISHTYTTNSTFNASLKVADNNGEWSNPSEVCSATVITASGSTASPSATIAPKGGVVTPKPTIKAASASAKPVAPNVPVAGRILPTFAVALSGLFVLGLGLLLAL